VRGQAPKALSLRLETHWRAARLGHLEQRHTHNTRLFHQLIDSPPNVEPSQVAVVLTNTQENNRNTGSVHHADKRANHVAHCVALGDDEAVHSDAVVAELTLLYMSVDCRKK
jgi:hypothetical protein